MHVILTRSDEVDFWLGAPWLNAGALQRPLPDGALSVVASGAEIRCCGLRGRLPRGEVATRWYIQDMIIETTGPAILPNEATLLRLANSCERLAGREDQSRLTLHDLDADDYRMIAGLLRALAAPAAGTALMRDAAPPSPEATNVVSVSA